MKKRIFSRLLTAILLLGTLTLVLDIPFQTHLLANDLDEGIPWLGEDLQVETLKPVDYVSVYESFETIIDQPLLIDTELIYVIENATDLYHLSRLSLGEDRSYYLSLNYVLGNDIDYYEALLENMDYRFYPIGIFEPFTGTFDGQGFEITNLYFQTILDEEIYDSMFYGMRYLSMFSKIGSEAHVHHFGLINPIMIQPIEWGSLSYASYLVGENYGTLDHIYVLDTREDASGLHVDGAFHLAGLVSINYGLMEDLWISSPYIRSRAVVHALSVSQVLTTNHGEINHIYYDHEVSKEVISASHSIGLDTESFQEPIYFSSSWYFNDAYLALTDDELAYDQLLSHDLYPSLQGLDIDQEELLISKPSDLLVMQELLGRSGFFRTSTFVLSADIDMRALAKNAYKAQTIGFNGLFKSRIIEASQTLYDHQPGDGGSPMHYAIFNLQIRHETIEQDQGIYGLFGVLFGRIENLNFRRAIIDVDLSTAKSKKLAVGLIAGQMIGGSIANVHIDQIVSIHDEVQAIDELSIGGFVAQASGVIESSSVTGTIYQSILNTQSSWIHKQGGMVADAHGLIISSSVVDINQHIDSTPLTHSNTYKTGGVIGYGENVELTKVIHRGRIEIEYAGIREDHLMIGGMFGELSNEVTLHKIYQIGSLSLMPTSTNAIKLAGLGNLEQAHALIKQSVHDGDIELLTEEVTLTDLERLEQTLYVTSGYNLINSESQVTGIYQYQDMNLDLSYVDNYAHLITTINDSSATIYQAENNGNLNFYTSKPLTNPIMQYGALLSGPHISATYLRNEGDIELVLTQSDTLSTPVSKLEVIGVMEKLNDQHILRDVYQGGNITITTSPMLNFDIPIHISGVLLYHLNESFSTDLAIDPTSIDFNHIEGPIHNILQSGNITVHGFFEADIYASGILFEQHGLLTQSVNIGDINLTNLNDIETTYLEASGITHHMIGAYAQLFDSVNGGDIFVKQMSLNGYAHASGITLRNDINASLQYIASSQTHHLSKIAFTMNYGDVYAWSESIETSYTISQETKTKASGILASGILSVVNSINLGQIGSKYLASGMIGFLPLNRFGTLPESEVYISNLIQYGKIRAISSYDWVDDIYEISDDQLPARTTYNAYGAMVGKIHTGTQTWAFAGDVTYPIDRIYFGYLINIDPIINMFANAPELSSSWADGFGNLQEANEVILNMLKYMGTTNPNDQSKAPFTYFFQGGWIGQYMGKVIDSYDLTDEEGGLFHTSHPFRSTRPIFSGTDQYIHDYITFIDKDHVNPYILNQLEAHTGQSLPGFYALSSSEKIGQGIFMPDNLDIENLHPYDPTTHQLDISWLGLADDSSSISYQLYVEMRQIRASFSATIYDLELQELDTSGDIKASGLTLSSPVIDENRKLITYYMPSNAELLLDTTATFMDIYRFIEVSDGLGRKVPDLVASGEQTYTWVGDYKKDGNDFVEIGPYHTTGTYMVSTNDTQPIDSYSRNTPVYSQTQLAPDGTLTTLFKHTPHTFIIFLWYGSGYRVQATSGYTPGYGAYEAYQETSYPTLYRYVGPSREAVTYIKTDIEEDVYIFDDTEISFGVNLASDAHVISQGSSLTYQGESSIIPASIPRSYGVYEAMYDVDGHYIDSVEDHYGKIRIYSQSYEPSDPASYQDYDIRIIRTAAQSLTDITNLDVEGVDALPVTYDLEHVLSTETLMPLDRNQKGYIKIRYETINFADLQSFSKWTKLYDQVSGIEVDQSLYQVNQGITHTEGVFNNQTGEWGLGYVDIELEIHHELPSGIYDIAIELMTGSTYLITFEKEVSGEVGVKKIGYLNETISIDSAEYTSYIPYGIYYDSAIPETSVVNFSNFVDFNHVSYDELNELIPSYLESIEIALFSQIVSIDVSMDMIDAYLHRYTITYQMMAEDGTETMFYHYLVEEMPNLSPEIMYRNGSKVEGQTHVVGYNESPTYRMDYQSDQSFIHPESPWYVTLNFIPLEVTDQVIAGKDYVLRMLPGIGFEIDFHQDMPIGIFEATMHFEQEVGLWDMELIWQLTYDTLIFDKKQNDDSKLKDIFFVSDAVFQGFNTIIDPNYLTTTDYQYLLMNPLERKVIQLPTTGMMYLEDDGHTSYHIIGQVQQTQLSYYAPTMVLPDGATIKRVIDLENDEPMYQSDQLFADFSPIGDDFNFIQYRIYAMDYEQYPDHFTDFYVAVQDITNMIRFDVTIENHAQIPLDEIFIKLRVCQTGDPLESCEYDNTSLVMGQFSYFVEGNYEQIAFQTTTYGTYQIEINLPFNYTYHLVVSSVDVIGNAFYIENSIFPRKVYMTLHIEDLSSEKPWGFDKTIPLTPKS